jgi:hypothetical protein
MKKTLSFAIILVASLITLSSATIIPIQEVSKQEVKIDYKNLKKSVEDIKGEKLTLKEKLALKLFKKELSKMEQEKGYAKPNEGGGKSQLIAALLAFFLGGLGIHRFYLGYTWQGVVQLLTGGGCGIWSLIDFVRILLGSLQPKGGSYAKTL